MDRFRRDSWTVNQGQSDESAIAKAETGTLQDIRGDVFVWNRPSYTTLNINDSRNSVAVNVTIDMDGAYMALTGASPGRILWNPADMASVNITTGIAADVINVRRNSAALTLNSAGGRDTVNLGIAGRLSGITANVTVRNTPSYSTLNLDVSADSSDRVLTFTNSAVYGLAPATIGFESRDLAALNVVLGRGNDTIHLDGSPAAATTNVDAGHSMAEAARIQRQFAMKPRRRL